MTMEKAIILTTKNGFKFKIIKESADGITNRLSVGGTKEDGCYIVYRGDTEICGEVLKEALEAFNRANLVNKTQNN